MKNLQFPVKFVFKISTLSNDFTASDANGGTIAYVKQKMFKLKEDISIFADETKSQVNFKIKADRWLDFSAAYSITDAEGKEIGKVARKGWASIWKAHYELIDQNENLQYTVREESAWVKVFDALLGEIPVLGFFTGYFFNPAYLVTNQGGDVVARLSKDRSLLGKEFTITKPGQTDADDDERIVLGLMMMVLLERRRG